MALMGNLMREDRLDRVALQPRHDAIGETTIGRGPDHSAHDVLKLDDANETSDPQARRDRFP